MITIYSPSLASASRTRTDSHAQEIFVPSYRLRHMHPFIKFIDRIVIKRCIKVSVSMQSRLALDEVGVQRKASILSSSPLGTLLQPTRLL